MKPKFYYIDQLVGCYFNQDFDIYGNTIEEILNCYIEVDNQRDFKLLINDIDQYLEQDDITIESEFMSQFGWEFDPTLWDTTAKDFLAYVREQVAAHLKHHYS